VALALPTLLMPESILCFSCCDEQARIVSTTAPMLGNTTTMFFSITFHIDRIYASCRIMQLSGVMLGVFLDLSFRQLV